MKYFNEYPKIYYDLIGEKPYKPKIATNIFARTKVIDSVKNSTVIYYTYDVQDGDTPEIIAHKYYGNPDRHWIILLANDIVDPYYDWVMTTDVFYNYIVGKYGSLANCQSQVDHYNKIVTKIDSKTRLATTNKYAIDSGEYANLASSSVSTVNLSNGATVEITTTKEIVYAYDVENDKNESHRTIKIIDKNYAEQIENELKDLLKT